jgi:hypothetical protein
MNETVSRHLRVVLGRNAGSQQGAQDAGGPDVSPFRKVDHPDLFAAALGHEVGRHAVERSHPVRLDHLLNVGAAFGQVPENRQALFRRGVIGVVEPGVAPGVLRIHPFSQST